MTEENPNPKYELHDLSSIEKSEFFSKNKTEENYDLRSPDQEIQRLVQLAEEVKTVCDVYCEKLEKLIFYRNIATASGFFILMIFFSTLSIKAINDIFSAILFSAFVYLVFLYPALVNARISQVKNKLDFEQNILIETVDLLREAGSFMHEQDYWTKFQEIEFKIRLSRFNVGKYKISQSFIESLVKSINKNKS